MASTPTRVLLNSSAASDSRSRKRSVFGDISTPCGYYVGLMVTLRDLKHHAIASSLFPATTLGRAVSKLGFVQADPIRSPARAQDLILRHRVTDYRVDDLDRSYRSLKLEEDYLYAYGFMPVSTWRLLHPRAQRTLTVAEQRVLDIVSSNK